MKARINTAFLKDTVDVRAKWTEVPSSGNQPLLGPLIGKTFLSPERAAYFQNSISKVVRGLMAYEMVSRWEPTTMTFDPQANNIVILSDSDPATIVKSPDKMKATEKLHINLSNVNERNAALTDAERPFTAIAYILKWFNVIDGYYDAYWSKQWPWVVATTLSLHMVGVLARINPANDAAIICDNKNVLGNANLDIRQLDGDETIRRFVSGYLGIGDCPLQSISSCFYAFTVPTKVAAWLSTKLT
jgi:hypothetical protein